MTAQCIGWLTLVSLLVFHAPSAGAQCGGFDQRACCVGQGAPCVSGAIQANACMDALGAAACRCTAGIDIYADGVCREVAPCGEEGQRACCTFYEPGLRNCAAGLAELPGCLGNCYCGGNARGEKASGMCARASHCGGPGERACCVLERGVGAACNAGLHEVPGCTGNCYCATPYPPGQVSSTTCTAGGAASEPGIDAALSATAPSCALRGYADMHMHLFAHLAHGEGVLTGKPYSALGVADALSNDADFTTHRGHLLAQDTIGWGTNDADGIFGSGNQGQPAFNNWPNWHSTTHQQTYYKWLERAWRGGLRLATVLAVTNEALCKSSTAKTDSECEDSMASIDKQLDAAWALQDVIDGQSGGAGKGWFRIVRTPGEARSVIAAGKLAVVLGIEVEHPFNCRSDGCRGKNAGETDADYVRRELDRYYDKGVRHIFPIHNFDNAFGGPATWQTSIDVGNRAVEGHWWNAEDCPGEGYGFKLGGVGNQFESFFLNLFGFGGVENVPSHEGDASCNAQGLTTLGFDFLRRLMDRGMLIDVDHMSVRAFEQTLALAESRAYPVVASHVQFFERHVESIRHERMRTREQLERIRDGGGMIAAMLKDDVQDTGNAGKRYTVPYGAVPNDCIHSSQTFAHSLQYAADVMAGPVAFGSDFNGIAAHVGPRFGSEACGGRLGIGGPEAADRRTERQTQLGRKDQLVYPFTLPGFGTFHRQKTGEREFDLNYHGLAHVGLLPDLVAELGNIGVPSQSMEQLWASAEGYIGVWERALGTDGQALCESVNLTVPAGASCRADVSAHGGDPDPDLLVSQLPAGPYGPGTTQVHVSVKRRNSCLPASSCQSTITVVDRTPPAVSCASSVTLECEQRKGAVSAALLAPVSSDNCGVQGAVACAPASGIFALGSGTLTCSAKDAAGNQGSCPTAVSVRDTISPVLSLPPVVTLECQSSAGTRAPLSASALDACEGSLVATSNAPALLPLNQTTAVQWTARDTSGNVGRASQGVSVVDSAPPVVSCPANVVSECVAGLGVGINLGRATASDLCGTATVPTNDGRAPWRLGVTNVTYTSHDAGGRVGSCRQTVSVVDTTPPRLAAVTAAPPVLVAGAMRDVTVVAVATDSCDVTPLPTCSIESITSAPVAPAADIAINAPLRASLRAVRGRQYTLNVVCKDRAGLSARAAATARTL